MIGWELAHYKIVEKLGSGGMGDVYVAKREAKALPHSMSRRARRHCFEIEL